MLVSMASFSLSKPWCDGKTGEFSREASLSLRRAWRVTEKMVRRRVIRMRKLFGELVSKRVGRLGAVTYTMV